MVLASQASCGTSVQGILVPSPLTVTLEDSEHSQGAHCHRTGNIPLLVSPAQLEFRNFGVPLLLSTNDGLIKTDFS